MDSVDKHLGTSFFSILSSAHTFNMGSLDRSSEIVTSRAVPLTCFMWVILPESWARKVRTTLKARDRIRTWPSLLPRKTLSDPEHTLENSLLCGVSQMNGLDKLLSMIVLHRIWNTARPLVVLFGRHQKS